MFYSLRINFNSGSALKNRGTALLATLMVMLGLAALIGFTSEQSLRFMESQRTNILQTSMTQVEESLLQAIQSSYYEEYRRVSASNTSKIIQTSELNSIVEQAYAKLGVSGSARTPITLPQSSGSEVIAEIELNFPTGMTSMDTQAKTPYLPIQGSYSWLDGISAVQKSIQVTLQLEGKNSFSGRTHQIQKRYQIQILEIPIENLSLSSLGNVNLPNLNIQASSGYFGGNVQGGTGVQFQERLVSGDRSGSAVQSPSTSRETPSGWTEKGYSEIVSTNTVRNLDLQRSPGLGTTIKSSYFFREGLASSSGFSSEEQSQLKNFQPYYQTPSSQRIYGTHDPDVSDSALAFTSSAGAGDEQNSSTLPVWCQINLQTNTIRKVQFLVDLSTITPDANQEVRLFVGSRKNSLTGTFDDAEVVILPWATIPSDRKITVISPNPIIISGDFNQGSTPASTHFFSNRVYYGETSAGELHFEGSYANYQQKATGASIDFRSRDGAAASTRNMQFNTTSSPTLHTSHAFYTLVLKSKMP